MRYIKTYEHFKLARGRRFEGVSGVVSVNEDLSSIYRYIQSNKFDFIKAWAMVFTTRRINICKAFNTTVDIFVPHKERFIGGRAFSETII